MGARRGDGARIGCNSGGGAHGIWLLCFEILNDGHTNQLQTELCCGANKTDAPSRTICNCTYVLIRKARDLAVSRWQFQ